MSTTFLDGDELRTGDNLYDLFSEQVVRVMQTNGDDVTVQYPCGTILTFDGPSFNGVRRLYWHDPRMLIPGKNDADLIMKIRQMVEVMRG